jgi:hypothetical protein
MCHQKLSIKEIADRTIMVITKTRSSTKFSNIVGKIKTRIINMQPKSSVGLFASYFLTEDKLDIVREAE